MFTLPKQGRLRKNKDFQAVYRMGKSYANRQLVLYILPRKNGQRLVGFAAGKRLGNAVTRNRVKRLLRETYRLYQHRLATGFDLIIVGRQTIAGEKMAAVAAAFEHLCAKAGILQKQAGTDNA
ncbi:MAG: ribonuclease P protein component [Negativicutes bacterium]|nr:ribonuclease P protein component [Negativicutes bacterium]